MTETESTTEARKRPRLEISEGSGGKDATKPTPAYGSQEYWEDRYKNKTSTEDDPEPYHAWYFTFEDLAPLLMPLILGSSGDDGIDEAEDTMGESQEGADNGADESSFSQTTKDDDKIPLHFGEKNDGQDDEDDRQQEEEEDDDDDKEEGNDENESDEEGFELVEMDDDDDDEDSVVRVGLAKKNPISVLEVGCGDAPLGRDLALSIQDYGNSIDRDPSSIVEKVVCMDYSKNVIETMKEEQEKDQSTKEAKASVPLIYAVADARQMAYNDESFDMILEKGTLDAMLSDSDGLGRTNCRKIVTECARVLKIGGYIVIISHLNARVESGLQWLNDIVVPGLRASGSFEWLIEVHGSEVEVPSETEDDAANEEEKCIESPGPAVYFIEKVGRSAQQPSGNDGNHGSQPTIPLKFFSY